MISPPPKSSPTGVLVMAYGGPENLAEIPGYLADIRSGRPTTRAVLEEITSNYRLIGGKSPLLEMTTRQAEVLEKLLNSKEPAFKVYLGMRHWRPWAEETVRNMLEDGIQRGIVLVLAPHYSKYSLEKYHDKVRAGLEMFGGGIEFKYIKSYNTAPGYIQALVNRVREGISRWPEEEQSQVHVVLSAHSLPIRILKMGDPYQDQLFETAALVARGAGLAEGQWSWSYQSAGRSPEPWLGPQIEKYIPELAARGINKVVSVPIGFVSDHVEILFDIDIKAQAAARDCGVRLERPPALNTDPLFIQALADIVQDQAAVWAAPPTVGGFPE